jgi:hypothetical protein
MIGKTKIVVDTPTEYLFTLEKHPGTDFSLKFREHEVTKRFITILAQRTT